MRKGVLIMDKEFEEFIAFRCKEIIHKSGIFSSVEEEEAFIKNNIHMLVKSYKKGCVDVLTMVGKY
jgi:hypothetical protein